MAHMLTEEQLARYRRAFAQWDVAGVGAIDAKDAGNVLRFLGETPTVVFEKICERHSEEFGEINFAEFLTIGVECPSYRTVYEPEKELLLAFAKCDIGNGFGLLRDVMRILDEHLEDNFYEFTDDELLDIYLQTLDVAVLQDPDGKVTTEMLRPILRHEFAEMRTEQRKQVVDVVAVGERANPAADWESLNRLHGGGGAWQDKTQPESLVSLKVVTLNGEEVMCQAFASTQLMQELQQQIETIVGLPVARQTLLVTGQALCRTGMTLSEAGIVDGTSVTLIAKSELVVDYRKFASEIVNML